MKWKKTQYKVYTPFYDQPRVLFMLNRWHEKSHCLLLCCVLEQNWKVHTNNNSKHKVGILYTLYSSFWVCFVLTELTSVKTLLLPPTVGQATSRPSMPVPPFRIRWDIGKTGLSHKKKGAAMTFIYSWSNTIALLWWREDLIIILAAQ